jgi:hypothetical protein
MLDPPNLDLFFSYSHADRKLRQELEKHLSLLKRQRIIKTWHDGKPVPGQEIDEGIKAPLLTADIILLLVSHNFMDSDYCYEKEMEAAVMRHEQGAAKVIPIILKPVEWQDSPFGHLLALPEDGKPVIKWRPRDSAFLDIAKGVRKAAYFLARHCKDPSILENTMSNRRYKADLAALDGKWDLKAVMNQETILIVVGDTAVTELLDRTAAEHLRDEIDERGDKSLYRRALVISYGAFQRETKRGNLSKTRPLISIGGPNSNDLTKELESSSFYTIAPDTHGSFRKLDGQPQAALWGKTAQQTRASVENYMARPDGLGEFLRICWTAKAKT